jgi:hypothetical protein
MKHENGNELTFFAMGKIMPDIIFIISLLKTTVGEHILAVLNKYAYPYIVLV